MMVFGDGAPGRSLGRGGEAFINEIRSLIKETPVSFLSTFTLWGHIKKTTIYEPESGPLPDT